MNPHPSLLLPCLIAFAGIAATPVGANPLFVPGPDGPQNGSPGAEVIGPVRPGTPPARKPFPDARPSASGPVPAPKPGNGTPGAPRVPMPAKGTLADSGRVTWLDGGSTLPKVSITGADGLRSETYDAGQAPAAIDAPFQSLRQQSKPPVAAPIEGGEILPPESALPLLLARLGAREIAVKPLGSFAVPPGSPVRLTLEAAPGKNQALILASRPAGNLLSLHFSETNSGVLLARAMCPSGGNPIALGFKIANANAIDLILSGEIDQAAPFDCQVYVGSAPSQAAQALSNPPKTNPNPAP